MRDILLAISLISLGAASGYGIKRALASSPASTATAPVPPNHPSTPAATSANTPAWQLTENRPPSEIAALPPGAMRTAETVLWLPNATAGELRDFWRQLIASGSNDYGLKSHLLDRWMVVAPDDALKETAGMEDEYLPWVAWGRIDPELGVREAKARKSGYLWRVLEGAAASQPELAQKLLAENPGYDYPAVVYAIKDGLQDQGWEVALNYQFDSSQLANWARYEPTRAFDWALDNPSKMQDPGSWRGLVERMLEEDPARLDATIAKLAEGKLKSDITVEKARALAASDPAAVLAMAAAAEPGGPRNRLLAIAAPALVESNPAKALELLREFAPGGFSNVSVVYPNGSSSSGYAPGYAAMDSWVLPLLKQNPSEVIKILPPDAEEQVMQSWRRNDLDGYASWVSTLADESARDGHYSKLAQSWGSVSKITDQVLADSMAWTSRISNEGTRGKVTRNLMRDWLSLSREQTTQYFGPDGPASDDQKAEFQKFIERKGGQR